MEKWRNSWWVQFFWNACMSWVLRLCLNLNFFALVLKMLTPIEPVSDCLQYIKQCLLNCEIFFFLETIAIYYFDCTSIVINCSWTKFIALIVNVLVFFMQIFAGPFCAFLLERSLTSQVTFSRFRSSFLSDLYCFHSEVKLVANIKSVTA